MPPAGLCVGKRGLYLVELLCMVEASLKALIEEVSQGGGGLLCLLALLPVILTTDSASLATLHTCLMASLR